MSKRDYYEVLGVGRSVGQQDLKSAYRKLALRYHPDKNPDSKDAEEHFKEAAEAYSVLSDPEKRARYDRFGHAGVGGGQAGFDPDIFSDFSDIFGDFFGFGDLFGGRSRSRGSRTQRGADLRYDLQISFEEAVFGVNTKIKIPRQESCAPCGGRGAEPSGLATCSTCSGQGQMRYQQGFFAISKTCSTCGGSGQIIRKPCPNCNGAGRLQKEKFLELKIPAGVDDSSRLRVTSEGEAGVNGGPPGDLYVIISVEEHPFFKRQGNDLFCDVPLTFWQAALGTEIEVPTLKGKETIRIPEATQTGRVFRLRNRGVPSIGGRGTGDQFVAVTVVTPSKLSDEQRELFQELAKVSGNELDEGGSLFDKVKEMFG